MKLLTLLAVLLTACPAPHPTRAPAAPVVYYEAPEVVIAAEKNRR